METKPEDVGVIEAILEALESQQLPRALDLMDKVELGNKLDPMDIAFLERLFIDTEELKPWLLRYPEYKGVVARAIDLYHDITSRALANEQSS